MKLWLRSKLNVLKKYIQHLTQVRILEVFFWFMIPQSCWGLFYIYKPISLFYKDTQAYNITVSAWFFLTFLTAFEPMDGF